MVYGIYCYLDKLVAFGQPFVDVNDLAARRNFEFAMTRDNVVGVNRADYTLFKLGTFNDASGEIVLESSPKRIMFGGEINV